MALNKARKEHTKTVKMIVTVVVALFFAVAAQAQIQSIKLGVEISYAGDPNAVYDVEYAKTVGPDTKWMWLKTVETDLNGLVKVFDPLGTENRTYRFSARPTLGLILEPNPGDGTKIDVNSEADVAVYDAFVGNADLSLDGFTMDFDKRLWQFAKSITILSGGRVIGGLTDLREEYFTQLANGDYRLEFGNKDFTLSVGKTPLTVHIETVSQSDLPTTTIKIKQIAVWASKTELLYKGMTSSERSFVFKNDPKPLINVQRSASSPDDRLVPISKTTQTHDVLLAKFDLKSQGGDGTLRQIVFNLDIVDRKIAPVTEIFGAVKISINGHMYSADRVALLPGADFLGYALFQDLVEALPKGQFVTVSVFGTVNPNIDGKLNGAAVSVSLKTVTSPVTANNPEVGNDANQPIDVVDGLYQGSTVTFTSEPAFMVEGSVTTGQPVVVNNAIDSYPITFTFSIAAANDAIYIPRILWNAVQVDVQPEANFVPSSGEAIGGPQNGDFESEFVIPAGGVRTFTLTGSLKGNGSTGHKGIMVIGIVLRAPTEEFGEFTILSNLDALQTEVIF
jgi:hypothetical protein